MSTLPVGINGTIPVAVLSEAFGAAFGSSDFHDLFPKGAKAAGRAGEPLAAFHFCQRYHGCERIPPDMYPNAPLYIPFSSRPATVDTDERRAVVRRLTDALYEYLTLDVTEVERRITFEAEARKPGMQDLVNLQETIEKLREQRESANEKVEQALEGLPKEMAGLAKVQVTSMLIDPIESQLKFFEGRLSELQAELETNESAAHDSVQS